MKEKTASLPRGAKLVYPSEAEVCPHWKSGLNRDMYQKFNSRWRFCTDWLQRLLCADRDSRNQRVIFKEAVHALVLAGGSDSGKFFNVMRHAQSVEQRLETIIQITPMPDYSPRLFSP